jgi:hypothetical protein
MPTSVGDPKIAVPLSELSALRRDAERFRALARTRYLAWNGRYAFVQTDAVHDVKGVDLAQLADRLISENQKQT